jgi:hypothetical protein
MNLYNLEFTTMNLSKSENSSPHPRKFVSTHCLVSSLLVAPSHNPLRRSPLNYRAIIKNSAETVDP